MFTQKLNEIGEKIFSMNVTLYGQNLLPWNKKLGKVGSVHKKAAK